jgi:hypothetical protein
LHLTVVPPSLLLSSSHAFLPVESSDARATAAIGK